jgi:hypothetical protein
MTPEAWFWLLASISLLNLGIACLALRAFRKLRAQDEAATRLLTQESQQQ